jgi:hypothetical protein
MIKLGMLFRKWRGRNGSRYHLKELLESGSFSRSEQSLKLVEEILRLLLNPKACYHVLNSLPLVHIFV